MSPKSNLDQRKGVRELVDLLFAAARQRRDRIARFCVLGKLL